MSTEEDICLWCQESLAQHGLVIELTAEDFKQMFKHDATCKKIHYACFKDYQKKRAKDSAENEQKRATEPTEPSSSTLDGPSWLRTLFPVSGTASAEIRSAWYLPVLDLLYICEFQVQIAARAWPGHELYHPHLCVLSTRRALVRPSGPAVRPSGRYFRRSSATFPRAHTRSHHPHEVQFLAIPSQPLSQPVAQADRAMPSLYNRFVPYANNQGYFNDTPSTMIENHLYFQGQPRPNNCIPSQVNPPGTYSRYSAVTHSQRIAGYQPVYQQRTQYHLRAQSHNRIFF